MLYDSTPPAKYAEYLPRCLLMLVRSDLSLIPSYVEGQRIRGEVNHLQPCRPSIYLPPSIRSLSAAAVYDSHMALEACSYILVPAASI